MERRKPGNLNCCWSFLLAYLWCGSIYCYNLDVSHPVSFSGPDGSLFGYSVLLHKNRRNTWLLVGAPVANSSINSSVRKPGAIFKCSISDKRECQEIPTPVLDSCGKTCEAERDNQWLGVSLSRQPSDGHVLACGHRWKNVFYSNKENLNKLPHGICYKYDADLKHSIQLIPCYKDHQRKFGDDYASCQAGIANFLTEDLMIMGAPGTSFWTGSVLVYNTSTGARSAYVDEDNPVDFGSYLGYSVGAGHFLHPDSTEIVGGAPQHKQTGKAYLFRVVDNILKIVTEVKGHKMGSYFGSSVCAVDLNGDGLSDLLVGAPMYSTVREEGRVHVYINQGAANMKEAEFQLVGSDSYAARFGESITDLGDIDDDGFHDVAVGAPQEEELRGAIYIYNGRKTGIAQTFSQRITGSLLGNDLKMFGQSVSGGIDVDGNGYQDVAVGSFLSDKAVVLRTRPVVVVEATMPLPLRLNRSVAACSDHGLPAVCINATVCFKVRDQQLQYNLTADTHHKASFPSRFYFHGNGTSNTTTGWVRARNDQLTCVTHQAFMKKDVRDVFTPIYFEVVYALKNPSFRSGESRNFPPLIPILQQRGGRSNLVVNKTEFARYCSLENCSSNLQVSVHLVLKHKNMSYFALGNGKTIMLNTTLVNTGDEAFLPKLQLRFPSNLHYIKVLDAVSEDLLHDNSATLMLPLRYGVDINIHGFVTPTSFVFGDQGPTPDDCYTETFNYTYKVSSGQTDFCSYGDDLCLTLECRLGDMDIGKEASIHMEVKLNPNVLQILPVNTSKFNNPLSGVFLSVSKVVLEGHFTQKPQAAVKVFIIVVSLLMGLLILALLIFALWKVSTAHLQTNHGLHHLLMHTDMGTIFNCEVYFYYSNIKCKTNLNYL
uniref:Integrin alpha-2 domain-containing protein n=1 Tax=Esox lucius TaxID=8010 RepID=A0A6Q2YIN8_ESOLU